MHKHVLNQIDPKTIGARLQEARRASGLTQHAVAEHMNMARTTLVAIEKGERRVTPHELLKFSDLFGRPVSEFVGRPSVTVGFVTQFRAAWRADFEKNIDLERVAGELQRLAEDYVELERLCELPLLRSYPPPYDTSKSSPEQAGEEIAAAERNRLGIGDGPVSNLRDRLENDVSMRIFYFSMPAKVSGVFAYNDILGACVGINANHPSDRRHWSLAHEYGHFLTNRFQTEITFLTPSKRGLSAERLADAFAETFLMPASGINRRFTEMHRASPAGSITLAQICTLADLYQVSVQALIIRLEKLKRLPTGTWDRLNEEGFRPRRAQELLGIEATKNEEYLLPQRYVNLAVLAYEKGTLSEGQLSRFLRTDRVSAREWVEKTSTRFNSLAETGFEPLRLDLAQALS
jgi:Zn-dependent peptidase ImmA (M78 family)/transcriptional regulator with XRE-family HTH domain